MTHKDAVRLKAIELRERAWSSLGLEVEDIKRVADGGLCPTPADDALVRMVFNVVLGDLCMRRSEPAGPVWL